MPNARDIGAALARVQKQAAPIAVSTLRKILDLAIYGTDSLPGAKDTAAKQLGKHGKPDEAIKTLIRNHVALAGAQGFLTNVGGLLTLTVTLPANLVGVAVVQARMIAAIAHLRGYDLEDYRVRTAIQMCLLGRTNTRMHLVAGSLPTTPMAVATAPMYDPELDERVSEMVLGTLMAQMGGRKVSVLFARRIPGLGGGVGAVMDGFSTKTVGDYACEQFVSRRLH